MRHQSAWWRGQLRLLTQNRSQYPFYHDHLGRSNQTMIFSKQNFPPIELVSLCTRDDVTMIDECKNSTPTSSTHVKKNLQMNTFHELESMNRCECQVSSLKYVFSIYNVKYVYQIGGIPVSIVTLHICILLVGCTPTLHGFSMMTPQQSGSPIGGKGNSQTTHGSIVVEWHITNGSLWH